MKGIFRDYVTRITWKGLPQGGLLSPLLYDLYIAEVIKNIPSIVQASQFADDIAVYCSTTSVNKSKKLLEESIKIINTNLRFISLDVYQNKKNSVRPL